MFGAPTYTKFMLIIVQIVFHRFRGSEEDRYFLKIPKWQHKHVRDYKRGKSVSYFLNNAAKICLYGLNISENIDTEHVFQSKVFFCHTTKSRLMLKKLD